MVRALLLALLALMLPLAGPAARAQAPAPVRAGDEARVVGPLGERLHAYVSRLQQYGFSGTVLVERRGEIVLLQGYGLANRERGIPAGPGTVYDMASIVKTFTGAAVLHLEAAGRLRTTDPLSRHLGPFPQSKSAATVHHLASHRAGLVVRGTQVGDADRAVFIQQMKDAPVESAPGEAYRYSNAGMSLLAALVEEASGTPFRQYLRTHLFAPAGMHAGFRHEPEWDAVAAIGYGGRPDSAGPETRIPPNRWSFIGAGGLMTTVPDVHRWVTALRSGRVLPESALRRAFDPAEEEAYGWHYEPAGRNGRPFIHKGGDTPGFESQILVYPADSVTIVWAGNSRVTRWRTLLNEGLSRIALGEGEAWMPPAPRADVPLQPFAGAYATPTGAAITVRAGDGFLYVAQNEAGVPDGALFHPVGNGVFSALNPRALGTLDLRFETDAAGLPVALAFTGGEQDVAARRVP